MPRAIVSKKGKLKKITPPVSLRPGVGKRTAYDEDGQIIMTDVMLHSRPMTRKEINFIKQKLVALAKKRGVKLRVK